MIEIFNMKYIQLYFKFFFGETERSFLRSKIGIIHTIRTRNIVRESYKAEELAVLFNQKVRFSRFSYHGKCSFHYSQIWALNISNLFPYLCAIFVISVFRP